MHFKHWISLLLLCVILQVCRGDKKDEADKKTFIATSEWQTVEEDDILPSGLHYRMNLQSGKKEAKLVDLNDREGDTSLTYDKDKQEESIEEKVAKSIKKIDDETNLHPELKTLDPTQEDSLKQFIKSGKKREKFRNYEELKSIFEEMNMTVDTDVDIMNKLFQSFELPPHEEGENKNLEAEVVTFLKDFEYLVSQIDNARHFVSQNGITKIIRPCLNSTNFEIRTEALKLLGSAVQNNIPVQIHSLEQNILQPVLHLFNQHVIGKEHAKTGNELDHVYRLKSAAVFAISCLIRNFPTAQNDFIKNGGLNILLNEKIFLNNCENGFKLQLKIASLLNTLLQERYDAQILLNIQQSKLDELNNATSSNEGASSSSNSLHQSVSYEANLTRSKYLEARSKVDQYAQQDLAQSLLNLRWCNIVRNLFVKNNYKANMESVTSILLTNLNLCDNFGRDKQLRNILINMRPSFEEYDEQSMLNLSLLYEVFVTQGRERQKTEMRREGLEEVDQSEEKYGETVSSAENQVELESSEVEIETNSERQTGGSPVKDEL